MYCKKNLGLVSGFLIQREIDSSAAGRRLSSYICVQKAAHGSISPSALLTLLLNITYVVAS